MYYEVEWSVATTLFGILQKAKHKIKTDYGISAPVCATFFDTTVNLGVMV